MKRIGKVRICSEEWEILADPLDGGGECHWSPIESPSSYITIGTKSADQTRWMSVFVHEALESILMIDNKRFLDEGNGNHRFILDHDYLCLLPAKLMDAMVSSGFFSINKAKIRELKSSRSTKPKSKK